MKKLLLAISSVLYVLGLNAQALTEENREYLDVTLSFETRAAILVERMTLDEKISQMGNNAPAIPRLGIPKYDWWNECLHGVARAGTATMFPQAIGLSATFDLEMMNQVAGIISDEARAKHHEALRNGDHSRYKGLTFWSPNINIFRDPRWGRGHETYGEDPYLTGQMGIQFVRGLQGDDPKYLKVVATAKHFAVHSGPEIERHSFNAVPNMRDLWETYLPAFEDLMVDAKAYSIMGAYNRVDGESASGSWMLLEDILRHKWGFEGYVVSDCGAIRDIHQFHKIVNSPEQAAAVGVRRGCDLNCGRVYQNALKKAVELGYIDEGELDRSLYRLMLARMKLGMFDPPEIVPYAQIPFSLNDSEPHNEMALKMARKSMTLLQNDGTLPLDRKKIKRIAVLGPNANNLRALQGNYHGDATNPVTVIEGIRNAAGKKIRVTLSEDVPMVINEEGEFAFQFSDQTLADYKKADVIVFVGGLDASWEGEEMRNREAIEGFNKGDRTRIELPKVQLDALRTLKETGKPIVFVLLAGSSVSFEGLEKDMAAILMGWYPGQRGGDAVADVLFGDYNPAGRLPVTFYSSTQELPDFRDYNMHAGKGFTYRYYKGDALYPFGHGLSYTEFEYSDLKTGAGEFSENDEITVSLKIKNTGNMNGEEVVQLYVKDMESDIWMPLKQLRGFERIALKKGEEKTVEFRLKVSEDLTYYNTMYRRFMVEPGEFEIQAGSSSEDIRVKKKINVKP
jgi:beta-glucosidase